MNLLLDTHAFIWWDSEPERLPADALRACQDLSNTLSVSVVSAREMQIKSQLGKLELRLPLANLLREQQTSNGVQVVPIELEHVLALSKLPGHHSTVCSSPKP